MLDFKSAKALKKKEFSEDTSQNLVSIDCELVYAY